MASDLWAIEPDLSPVQTVPATLGERDMKYPKKFQAPVPGWANPTEVLKDTVRALEIDLRVWRANGWKSRELKPLIDVIGCLKRVAQRQAWNEAFDWPAVGKSSAQEESK